MRLISICVIFFALCTLLFSDIFGNGTFLDSDVPVKIRDNVEDVFSANGSSYILLKNRELWASGYGGCGDEEKDTYTRVANNVYSMGARFYITTNGDLFKITYPYEKLACPYKLLDKVLWYDGWKLAIRTDNTLWNFDNPTRPHDTVEESLQSTVNYSIMDDVQKAWYSACDDYYDECGPNPPSNTYSLAVLKTDGSLYMQGFNYHGQLGVGSKKYVKNFEKVMDDVKLVAFSRYQSFVVKNDKSLWVAGKNLANFGNGSRDSIRKFIKVADDVIDVQVDDLSGQDDLGGSRTFILRSDGSLWFSGVNRYWNFLDFVVPFMRDVPKVNLQFIKVYTDVKKFYFDQDHLFIIKNDNSLWAVGKNISHR